jgi:serine/threonine-protein kinase RsbW
MPAGKIVLELKNQVSELARLQQTLAEFGQRHGLAAQAVHDLTLALEEILTNIIAHGYTDHRDHAILVRLSAHPDEVRAEVEDDGQPFNPLAAPAPDTVQSLENRPIGGLGIHLVRNLMDGLEYQRQEGKNRLLMKKNLG